MSEGTLLRFEFLNRTELDAAVNVRNAHEMQTGLKDCKFNNQSRLEGQKSEYQPVYNDKGAALLRAGFNAGLLSHVRAWVAIYRFI